MFHNPAHNSRQYAPLDTLLCKDQSSVPLTAESTGRIHDERLLPEPRRSLALRRSLLDFRFSTGSLAIDFATFVDSASVVRSFVRRDVDRRTGSSRFSIRDISSGGKGSRFGISCTSHRLKYSSRVWNRFLLRTVSTADAVPCPARADRRSIFAVQILLNRLFCEITVRPEESAT